MFALMFFALRAAAQMLLLYMVTLLAPRGEKDVLFRAELATAIVEATPDAEERLTLARLAKFEAGYRRNVARCEVKGDKGKSLGEFQIQPICAPDPAIPCRDRKLACGSLPEQVGLALRYLRRSAEVCASNVGAAKLNLYTSGRCDHGQAASEERWGGQDLARVPVGDDTESPHPED